MLRTIRLPSGPVIRDPIERLLCFCREECAYYDALPASAPDQIEPLDVVAAVAVNGFYNADAATIRAVDRGLANACNLLLPAIPPGADLCKSEAEVANVAALLHAAIAVP